MQLNLNFNLSDGAINVINITKRVLIIICMLLILVYCFSTIAYQVYGEYQYVVFIHAGHGGVPDTYDPVTGELLPSDPGAEVNGVAEKDLNLSLAKKVAVLLENYNPRIKVVMPRTTDVFYHYGNVANDAKKAHATLVLSIHHNYFKDSRISGTETFYSNPNSLEFANNVQKHLVSDLGFGDRGAKQFNYTTISGTNIPSVLAEIGFMTNPSDFSVIIKDESQDKEAEALKQAILDTLGI